MRNAAETFVRDPKGKRCGGCKSSWVYNIKMDFREIRCVVFGWIKLAVSRVHWRTVVNKVMDPWGP
jgi:hypothetical protein